MHFACARGNLEIVRHLIETVGLDYKIRDKEGNTPFLTSIEHGHLPLVQYFVEEIKTSPNESKEGEISTLHLAANHNHVEIINYLIGKGADPERISIYGKPINWSVGAGNLEATETLLSHGASPDGDSSGSSVAPLILAIDHKHHALYKLLVSKGANVNTRDPMGYSVLHVAAEKGDLEIVKDLVSRGANLQHEA